jgi:hypothetical protein
LTPAPANWAALVAAPRETALQLHVRDRFEELRNFVRELPECVEKTRALGQLVGACELVVTAAGKVT